MRELLKKNKNHQQIDEILRESINVHLESQIKPQKVTKFIHLQIIIRDTGVGIEPEDLSKLFIDFGKLDDKEGRNKSGTGLGLSICKQIIDEMGGSIEVSSKVGRGTDFIINLKTKSRLDVNHAVQLKEEKIERMLVDLNEDNLCPETFDTLLLFEAKPEIGIESLLMNE